jgi:tetraacyldisaccharide 4'-kinase
VSVGNLRAGGSGKTPAVAHIARELAARGERPVILSRGYRRPAASSGVTIVSNGSQVLATFETAGDEPLMLARTLAGVPVLVGADRYQSGRLAEERFGATVHLLDDGFQHLQLARDVNLLLVDVDDLADRVLPAGWLREPLSAAAAADAVIVNSERPEAVANVAGRLQVADAFQIRRSLAGTPLSETVVAIAGIARPERFFNDLAAAGWKLGATMRFADHHVYSATDVDRIVAAARDAGASTVVTTEKDAVRFEAHQFNDDLKKVRLITVPMNVSIEPANAFVPWLLDRLEKARSAGR